jgi:hypothetical protein
MTLSSTLSGLQLLGMAGTKLGKNLLCWDAPLGVGLHRIIDRSDF